MDITEAIKAKGYEIDRRQVSLREQIKETGDYTVNVKLYRDVVLQVPVKVTAEGGEVAEPKADKNAR
jgi:large subunit ribosomal protein L9